MHECMLRIKDSNSAGMSEGKHVASSLHVPSPCVLPQVTALSTLVCICLVHTPLKHLIRK